jgi:hypothetical protein
MSKYFLQYTPEITQNIMLFFVIDFWLIQEIPKLNLNLDKKLYMMMRHQKKLKFNNQRYIISRQDNVQKKKYKRTKNDLQNIHINLIIE